MLTPPINVEHDLLRKESNHQMLRTYKYLQKTYKEFNIKTIKLERADPRILADLLISHLYHMKKHDN